MNNTTFAIKWHTHENNAEQQVSEALEHLDRRKKALKDEAVNKRIVTSLLAQGNMRGVAIARYGHDSFLAINPDAVVFTIDTTLVRYTGKSGQRPLLNITDIYQRQHLRWGGKAQ